MSRTGSRWIPFSLAVLALAVIVSCAPDAERPASSSSEEGGEVTPSTEKGGGTHTGTGAHSWPPSSGFGGESTSSAGHSAPKPGGHLWTHLEAAGAEPRGYGLYTYVLTGRRQPSRETQARYQSLLRAITSSTATPNDLYENFDPRRYNLFLIPRSAEQAGGFDARLSAAVVTAVGEKTSDESLREALLNAGPILLTTPYPLTGDWDAEVTDVFYFDLTDMNPAAMREVVKAYKKELTTNTVAGVDTFRSLRLAVLDVALDADDHIGLIKVVYADWQEAFGD